MSGRHELGITVVLRVGQQCQPHPELTVNTEFLGVFYMFSGRFLCPSKWRQMCRSPATDSQGTWIFFLLEDH